MAPEGLTLRVPQLLLKGEPDRVGVKEPRERPDRRTGRTRIRCPRCAWEPGPHDRWQCNCLYLWNTFETGGVCPGCNYQWLETMCPRCRIWSPHRDWYVDEPDP